MAVYSMSLVLLEYEGRHAGLHAGSVAIVAPVQSPLSSCVPQ